MLLIQRVLRRLSTWSLNGIRNSKKKLLLFLDTVWLAFTNIFKDPECQQCKLYREWLEYETAEKKKLQELLFQRVGLTTKSEAEYTEDEWPTIQKSITLSDLRRQLEHTTRIASLATKKEKTNAEELFERQLNGDEQT